MATYRLIENKSSAYSESCLRLECLFGHLPYLGIIWKRLEADAEGNVTLETDKEIPKAQMEHLGFVEVV